jgi:hypothetical protein
VSFSQSETPFTENILGRLARPPVRRLNNDYATAVIAERNKPPPF